MFYNIKHLKLSKKLPVAIVHSYICMILGRNFFFHHNSTTQRPSTVFAFLHNSMPKTIIMYISVLPCSSSPCRNGGTCNNNAGGSGYTCNCPSTHTGTNCENGMLKKLR